MLFKSKGGMKRRIIERIKDHSGVNENSHILFTQTIEGEPMSEVSSNDFQTVGNRFHANYKRKTA